MQGNIVWQSDSTSDVVLMVTHTAGTEEQLNNMFTDDPGSSIIAITEDSKLMYRW